MGGCCHCQCLYWAAIDQSVLVFKTSFTSSTSGQLMPIGRTRWKDSKSCRLLNLATRRVSTRAYLREAYEAITVHGNYDLMKNVISRCSPIIPMFQCRDIPVKIGPDREEHALVPPFDQMVHLPRCPMCIRSLRESLLSLRHRLFSSSAKTQASDPFLPSLSTAPKHLHHVFPLLL